MQAAASATATQRIKPRQIRRQFMVLIFFTTLVILEFSIHSAGNSGLQGLRIERCAARGVGLGWRDFRGQADSLRAIEQQYGRP